MTTESIDYPEQMRRDREEITRLRAQRDQLLAALKPMVDAWDYAERALARRVSRARAAIKAVEEKP